MTALLDEDRPPAWRYDLAKTLVTAQSYGTRAPAADEWTHRLAWCLADGGHKAPPAVLRAHGGVGEAVTLHARREEARARAGELSGPAARVLELDTLVLAGMPAAKIADRTHLAPDAVRAYEALFFDVRSRLGRVAWVCGEVLEPLTAAGLTVETLVPRLIRAYGYFAKSPALARFFMTGIDGPAVRRAAKRGGAVTAAMDDLRGAVAQKAVLVTRMTDPSDPRRFRSILEMLTRLSEDARQAGQAASGSDHEKYRQAVDQIFGGADFRYGEDPVDPPPRLVAAETV